MEEFNKEPDILFSGETNDEGNYLIIKVNEEVIGTISYTFNNGKIKAYKKCGFKEINVFIVSDYYSDEDAELYGEGDYGADETVNLIYEMPSN